MSGQYITMPFSIIERWREIGLDGMSLWTYLRYRTNGQSGDAFPSYAQKAARTLTLLYSNNINGEIEPCPT